MREIVKKEIADKVAGYLPNVKSEDILVSMDFNEPYRDKQWWRTFLRNKRYDETFIENVWAHTNKDDNGTIRITVPQSREFTNPELNNFRDDIITILEGEDHYMQEDSANKGWAEPSPLLLEWRLAFFCTGGKNLMYTFEPTKVRVPISGEACEVIDFRHPDVVKKWEETFRRNVPGPNP
ncbi:hypothetical protein F4780DRAFT_62849 [Xylariomycetidae sp. FL0641]|nr:hypothetical protein F4780DRAFT_62849 [Xylariomycetidae sp. FL0641]